jgi:hypothetical protein
MDIEQIIPPPGQPEARFRLELTETELVAVINRLIPEGTWLKGRSAILIRQVFAEDPAGATRLADEVTHMLVRAYDNRTDPRWVRRV